MGLRCRHRSDVESGVVAVQRSGQFGKQVPGDKPWRFANGDVDIDLLPCGKVFGHFLRALPLELSSQSLEFITQRCVSESCKSSNEVVRAG